MNQIAPGTKVLARFSDQNGHIWAALGVYRSRIEYIAKVEFTMGDDSVRLKAVSYDHLIPLGPVGELLYD